MARRPKPKDNPAPAPSALDAWWGPAAGPLPTPRTMLQARVLRLRVRCEACGHHRDADLQALVDRGRGDVLLIQLKFRCSVCGSRQTNTAIMSRTSTEAQPGRRTLR